MENMARLQHSVWIVLPAVLVLAILLLDPLGWFVSTSPDRSEAAGVTAPDSSQEQLDTGELVQSGIPAPERIEVGHLSSGMAVLSVLEMDGSPVINATVVICREQEVLHQALTDTLGQVEIPSEDSEVTLVVSTRGRPVYLNLLGLPPGPHELRLPADVELTGKVLRVDGMPAAEMRLFLPSNHPYFDHRGLPPAALKAIGFVNGYNTIQSTTLADGSFRFAGLDDSWSGSLRLPYGQVIERASAGQLTPGSNRLRLDAPVNDLLIRLARAIHIRGRLISSRTGEVMAMVDLAARNMPVDGSPQELKHATTDEEGAFTFMIDPEMCGKLDLYLGTRFDDPMIILSLEASDIPADGDLGRVEVAALRTIPFLLRDRLGQPIANGVASTGGLKSAPTDPEGAGILPWVPPTAQRLRFVAQGFVPTEFMLEDFVPNPLLVTMDQANSLEIELHPPAGIEVSQFRALVKADARIIQGPASDLLELQDYLQDWVYPPIQMTYPKLGSALFARPNASGLIVFQALQPDLDLDLEIYGITGSTVYAQETLQALEPGEVRRHVVDLAQAGRLFHGRVVDAMGNPMVLAFVQLGGQILDHTDASGSFSCLVTDTEPRTLVVSHNSSATLFLPEYLIPEDGSEVELRLEPALLVVIEVVDEAGIPMPDARVDILRSGFTSNTHPLGGGRFEAQSLSAEMVRLKTRVAGREYLQDHMPAQSVARVVVPVHGSLSAEFTPPQEPGSGHYSVIILAQTTEDRIFQSKPIRAADGWRCEFPFVFPGEYEVSVNFTASPEDIAAGLESRTIGDPVTLQVEAGIKSRVKL